MNAFKKSNFKLYIILAISILIFSLSYGYIRMIRGGITGGGSVSPPNGSEVYIVTNQDVVKETTVSGVIKPALATMIYAEVQGKIEAILKKEGEVVKKGEVILKIDAKNQENLLEQFESKYRIAKLNRIIAELNNTALTEEQLKNSQKQAQSQLLIAEANYKNFKEKDNTKEQESTLREQVKQAEANLIVAKNNLKSLEEYDISGLQLTLADFSATQAELNLNIASLRLAILVNQGATEEQIRILEEQVKNAESNLKIAELRLEESAKNPQISDEQIRILEEQVKQARSSLEIAKYNLANTKNSTKAKPEDTEIQKSQVELSKISLYNAEINYQIAKSQYEQKKIQIESQKEQIKQSESALQIAKNNLDSFLKTKNAKENDESILISQVEQAKSAYSLSQKNLEDFKNTKKKNDFQIESLKEQEKQALLSLNSQKIALDNYFIKAPYDGTIIFIGANLYDNISPQTTLIKIANLNNFVLEAYVDEIDIVEIQEGQTANIFIDAFFSENFKGSLSYTGRSLTKTSEGVEAYKIKLNIIEPKVNLVDGMSADANIIIKEVKGVMAVPFESIFAENGKKYVLRIEKGNYIKQEVQTGLEGDTFIEIKSGLKLNDKIVRNVTPSAIEKIKLPER